MQRIMKSPCKDFELAPGEEIKMVIRRHWAMDMLITLRWLFLGVAFVGLGFGLFFLFGGSFGSLFFWSLTIVLSVYFTVVTIGVFIHWLNATFDIIFVTNDRIIDISQIDFFHRNIIETRLENIQDATGDVKGFLNTLFDWGKIQIRTANDIADFSIDAVQSPQMRSREIFKLANDAQDRQKEKGYILQNKIREEGKRTLAEEKKKFQKNQWVSDHKKSVSSQLSSLDIPLSQ